MKQDKKERVRGKLPDEKKPPKPSASSKVRKASAPAAAAVQTHATQAIPHPPL
jgi:hypothetical protein